MRRDYGNPSLGNDYAGGGIGLGPVVSVVERESYPAPEVTSRMPAVAPNKKAVADLEILAERFGCLVVTTYARGCFPHATTGTPGPVKESLAVRINRGSWWAVAVYVGGSTWSWDTLAVRCSDTWPARYDTLAEFLDGAFGPILDPIRADRPMEGPARRALKDWGPLRP